MQFEALKNIRVISVKLLLIERKKLPCAKLILDKEDFITILALIAISNDFIK